MEIKGILTEVVMPKMGLTPKGEAIAPNEGRIAHNLIIPTEERGEVLFRCYPSESSKAALGYGTKQAKFELRTLSFLAQKGAPVPKPIKLANDDAYAVEEQDWFIFAYPIEQGITLEQDDLSRTVAEEAGNLLSEIMETSVTYLPQGDEPNGDIDYIERILNNFINRRPDMADEPVFGQMFNHLSSPSLREELEKTPKGLVHGDFFFENVLSRDGRLVGVIDFGDAYHGYLLMDVVIGSMEFAMKAGEEWDHDLHEAFLRANKDWLKENNVSFGLFHDVLLANCVRFTAHLSNLTQDELDENGTPEALINPAENPYVQRFHLFQEPDMKTKLEKRYQMALS